MTFPRRLSLSIAAAAVLLGPVTAHAGVKQGPLNAAALQRISSLNRYLTKGKAIVEKEVAVLEKEAPRSSSQPAILQRYWPTKTALAAQKHAREVSGKKAQLHAFESGLQTIGEALQTNDIEKWRGLHDMNLWNNKGDQLGRLESIVSSVHSDRFFTKRDTREWQAARKDARNRRTTDFDAMLSTIEKQPGTKGLAAILGAIRNNRGELKKLIHVAKEQVATAEGAVNGAANEEARGLATQTLTRKQAVLASYKDAAFKNENYILKLFYRKPGLSYDGITRDIRFDRMRANGVRVEQKKADPAWQQQRADAKEKLVIKLGDEAGREEVIAKMLKAAAAK